MSLPTAPTQNQPVRYENDIDTKAFDDRVEDAEFAKGLKDRINDQEAALYADHTVVIDEAENKRLKRMIDRR